jgi:hypothetical protein
LDNALERPIELMILQWSSRVCHILASFARRRESRSTPWCCFALHLQMGIVPSSNCCVWSRVMEKIYTI